MADNYTQATVTPFLPATIFTTEEREALEQACGLTCEETEGVLYFFADYHFTEIDTDDDGREVNGPELLQAKLRDLDPEEYPHVVIEGVNSCSKMRPGEFGGFAFFITREEIRWESTWAWIDRQTPKQPSPAIAF